MATDLTQIHKHHIVPKYICKELGIDPDFNGNTVDTTRKQHALIHWGYHCNDLSPLLELCSPSQYVQDMIPLGDSRDVWAAQLIALGEVDGIIPLAGKDHPSYKHGRRIDGAYDPIYMKEYYKKNREKLIIQKREYENRPETKAKRAVGNKEYYEKNKEKIRAYQRERYYKNREKLLADKKEYYDPVKRKEMYERKKLERATATLDKSVQPVYNRDNNRRYYCNTQNTNQHILLQKHWW